MKIIHHTARIYLTIYVANYCDLRIFAMHLFQKFW